MNEFKERLAQLEPAWDRNPSRVAGLDEGRSYWRRELESPPVLQLPTDFTRSSTPSERAGYVDIRLPENLVLCLRQLAGCEQSTFFSILLTTFTALLHRYTGQDDIVVGCPVASCDGMETEPLIGVFINTLPFRARFAPKDTFRQLLQRVSESVIRGLQHLEVPLPFLVQDTLTDRDLGGSPLFRAMFIHERLPLQSRTAASVTFEPQDTAPAATVVDITLELMESPTQVSGRFVYRTELFEQSTIERMTGHFLTLLEGIVAAPDQRVGQLPLLSEAERHQLLVEWNDTAVDYPNDKCVHQLFEEQVERTPDAVAVIFEEQQLSYRELNERSKQLAHHLIALGVGPDTLVGLCLDRSLDLVVGVLGILKAGGAYVPLDVNYPPQRLEFMLRDSAVKHAVTQRSLLDRLPVTDCAMICLDTEAHNLQSVPHSNPSIDVGADNLAYAMYTSGSTGKPKCVLMPHSALVNLINWHRHDPHLMQPVRTLQFASYSFDVSFQEMLTTWCCGGSLVLISEAARRDPRILWKVIVESGVERLFMPFVALQQLATVVNGAGARLRAIVSAGEALQLTPEIRHLVQSLSNCRLHNHYGPTESHVVTSLLLSNETVRWPCEAPIGRPIANTQIYVLDAQLQPVPTGVPGELYIGGAGLARGYHNQAELTAEKFVRNPFSHNGNSRLYRTGDLCRWRADGNLEFLGRIDDQVKLRGFRIELGEIEAAMNEHPSVAQGVVVLREDRPGDKRLVAYCVAAKEGTLNHSDLTRHLHAKLPDYMVPSAFVLLDAFPLTSSGKVNRRALPAPDDSRPELETHYVAPRTPIEQQLASIWAEVLGIEAIGIHDNFFALGGHSLLATRVIARISTAFQVDLPLRKVFEAPTIAELASEMETLRSGGRIARRTALMRVDRDQVDRLPLSFAQQRLWFLEQMEGELTAYNIPYGWKLRGSLDVEALRRALEEIVRRHEPLRTTYAILDDAPVQVIQPSGRFELAIQDLSSFASERQTAEIVVGCRQEAEKPFNLNTDRMLRASLLQLADDEHVLLVTMHHIASDGWSLYVLWRELAGLYDAYSCGVESNLGELPVQYADYAVWQRSELDGQRLEQLLQYWREQLAVVSVLELPTDRPRLALPTYRGAQHSFELPEALVSQLRGLSQAAGVTLHMTLLAAFQTLLSRYSGQDDIAVGVPVAGRNQTELEDLIGFFVNTLVLRSDLSKDPTFRELLGRVREVSLAAYDHQDLPFERLVEELRPERQLSRSPLFQVLFQLQNFVDEELALRNLDVSRLPSGSQRVRFDLEMHLWQQDKTLSGSVVYSTDLFDASTIERMVGHFITLLEGIVAAPDQRISALPLLSAAERHKLLVEWNGTATDYPNDRCVHQLFEEQVERTPDAMAVVFEDQQLTYRELNERANKLAHHLIALGVGPETLVGLCLDRSLELVVGILGILKAGGAYVPLDVNYPPQRLEFMLLDSAVKHVVTQRSLLDRLPVTDCAIICLDTEAQNLQSIAHSNPSVDVGAENLAYAMYTSGSTGKPKCVLMPHAALVNLINWHRRDPYLMQPARTLQFASYSFDVAFQEMLTTLCCGGSLVLISEAVRRDPHILWKVIVESGVERVFMPFVALQQLATVVNGAGARLRDIVSAGEALQLTPEIRHMVQSLRNCRLHNHYGPTESHVVTSLLLSNETVSWPREAPIGRPIANTQIYVLDAQLQPAPIGVPGELYIGGAGLARGYQNQPELTAEKFVRNPFSHNENSRLYRTGDLGRWRADGNLEFLGRIDDQVKLRGFRIELGEIEAALNEHPSVAQGVVILREDRPGDKRLVAYCVTASDSELNFSELRTHLRSRLPDYMLPSAFVRLDSLPLTPSGKIDRRRLPIPDNSRPELESKYVVARDPLEEQLTSIWCELLRVERIGIHDNFFALGGHSLLATRVSARVLSSLEVELPLRKLFEAPTIAELAVEIRVLRTGEASLPLIPLTCIDWNVTKHPSLSFAQQRLWFLEQIEGDLTAYNMPYAWRLNGSLNIEALRRALEEVVRRHEPLRTTFSVVDGEPVQVIRKMERWELPLEDLGELSTDQQTSGVMSRFQVEAERPFDLSSDLTLRTTLLRLNDQEHVLLLTMHHIASDGWSLQVFCRELGILYKSYCDGAGESGLAELPVQYADYSDWQRKVLAGQRLETLLEYWRKQLNGVTALELPSDQSRPARPSYRGASYDFELGSELVSQLKLLCQSEGVTLHMTLLAAFQTLLSRYTGQEDISVGVPTAGRNHAELEDLIGFFVNTVVLRTNLSGDPTFRELLGRVREVSLSAYDHQDLPFEKLVEELRPERQLNRSPLFQVLFQLLNFSDEELALRNLDVSRLPSGSQRVRFDLEMHLWQQPETIRGSVVYSTDLFDVSTIERMVGHFITLLEGIVAAADQRISALPLLTELERHQLLVEWNDTAVEYPRDKCVHELFEEQVERTPDAVAVVFEEQQLSYGELNERANQLAHHLIALGVGPETLVGLCLNRSLEMVVGILGILKAGGAYVPIEADSPRPRLELILADARIEVLVTQESLRSLLPAADWRVICLDTDAAKLREIASTNPLVKIAADNLAYVIYTSGSTGIPKGVAVRHRSITRLVLANDYAKFGPDRVFLQLAPVSFDASTFELWGSLLHGAKLVLAPPGLPDFQHLEAILKRNRVTTLWLTATLFNQVIEHSPQTLSSVQEILTGGEALSVRHIVRAQTFLGSGVQLINGYGPTESTTFTTCYRISSQIDAELASIPIGRPISNTQVYVLDKYSQAVPIGVPGELYIGGTGLARGYLNRSELTAEKFVANPFSEDTDSRLYRTGDLCRWRSDGNLEFIGRIDDQVKLRGYRIELGEIEAALNEHPSVAQGVVTLREDRPGDKRLVAYSVAASDHELHFSELRSYLQQRLPDYMLPAAFVRLDSLPLTPSGKIDRRKLPALDDSRPELENCYVGPRNPLEEQLTQIWCDVLSIDKVGIHDNFFELGGHSLLVARMVGSIDRHCRLQISIASVFRNPTIAQLARCLDRDVTKESIVLEYESMFLSVLRKGKGTGTLVCLGVTSGPLMVQLPQHFGVLKLDLEQYLSIEQLTDVFATEVQRVVKSGPIILVGFSYGGLVAFALASRLRRRFRQTVELVMIEPSPPARKCDLVHTGAKTRTQSYLVRHLENLRAVGIKGWLPYIMEKVSFNVRYRLLAYCERRVIGMRIKLNLPLTPGQKWRYNLPKLVRNIRNYSIENLQGNAHLLGSAEYLQKHEDFWRTTVEGECRTKLLKNSSHHKDILDPAKSDEWIRFLAKLARSAKQ